LVRLFYRATVSIKSEAHLTTFYLKKSPYLQLWLESVRKDKDKKESNLGSFVLPCNGFHQEQSSPHNFLFKKIPLPP
jgi:hypothetical protein